MMVPPKEKLLDRDAFIDDASQVIGAGWAEDRVAELRRDNRPVTGGWPGTISEARGRARTAIDRLLAHRKMASLSPDELTRVSRATYDSARRLWLSRRVRTPED